MLPDTSPVADAVELSVVMPVFNEEGTVVEAVKRALDVGVPAPTWKSWWSITAPGTAPWSGCGPSLASAGDDPGA